MELTQVVKTKKNKYVCIDTCSLDHPLGNALDLMGLGNSDAVGNSFETMVFACNKKGEVESWGELDKENYKTEKQAIAGHKKMIKKYQNQ